MGPFTISHISTTTSRYLRPDLAISDGLVVIPSTRPMACASRTSRTSPVSMKNFMYAPWSLGDRLQAWSVVHGLDGLGCRQHRRELRGHLLYLAPDFAQMLARSPGLVGEAAQFLSERVRGHDWQKDTTRVRKGQR